MKIINKQIQYDKKIADEISTKRNKISPGRIIEIYNRLINKSEQDLLTFYQTLLNQNKVYEAYMTQIIHIELLLRKVISLKLNISIDDFSENGFYDLANITFKLGLINEAQGKELHAIRNLRNKFAHEFLAFPNIDQTKVIQEQGQNFIKIMELNETIKKLENENKES